MEKLCKPVLIKSNETVKIGDIVKSKIGDIHVLTKNDGKEYIKTTTKQQLILISLDPNEKIEAGELVYDTFANKNILWNVKLGDINNPKNLDYCFKVIATQSQLSPEYIQQFIDEYNKGCVKDVKIMMETDDWDYKNDIPHGNFYNTFKPKLTNGFVTIIENEKPTWDDVWKCVYSCDIHMSNNALLCMKRNFNPPTRINIKEQKFNENMLSNMQYYMEYCQANGYVSPQVWLKKYKHYKDKKEPVSYTEEEVLQLLLKAKLATYDSLYDWFNENKK